MELDNAKTIIVIISSMAGALLILCLIIVIFVFICQVLCSRRNRTSYHTRQVGSMAHSMDHVALGSIGDFQDFGVIQPTYTEQEVKQQKRNTFLGSNQFPRGDLILLDRLGEGEYGPIYRGEAYGLGEDGQSRAVTVKMLSRHAKESRKVMFRQDMAFLSSLNHVNVVGVLSVCTDDTPECILLDAGRPGDLHTHVQERKMSTKKKVETLGREAGQLTISLLKMADEVCLGMSYLASLPYVHKDLALRNCIISYDGLVKIADFGLGPVLYPEAYYEMNDVLYPIRWMPPEALLSGEFTTASDIWAFGVLMWELFTQGDLPYTEKEDDQVVQFVAKDYGRLPMPEYCIENTYLIMSSCWEPTPEGRPSFLTLHEHLYELREQFSEKSRKKSQTQTSPPAS